MKNIRKFRDRLNEDLKDENFKEVFDKEDVLARLSIQIARLREEQGLTQRDLARYLHTSQQTISRLESPGNKSFSLVTLLKLARAFHKKLDINFV